MFLIHYHKDSGRISAWGNGESDESHFADHLIARFEDGFIAIDPQRQKIDIATLELIDKPHAERIEEMRLDVDNAIEVELRSTDQFMLSDAPIDEAEQNGWRTYRKQLRELAGSVDQIIERWPARPDGADAAANLRTRLKD